MNVVGFAVFFLVMLTLLTGLNVHVFRWAKKTYSLQPPAQRLLKGVLGLALAGMILGRTADRVWPGAPVGSLIAVASTVELAVIISGILLLLLSAVLSAGRLLLRTTAALRKPAVQLEAAVLAAAVAEPTRRTFIAQAAASSAFLIGSSSSLYGALAGRYDYSIEEVPIRLPGLSKAFDGFSIVQLSDVHIGVFVGEPELAAAEALIRQAKPDLIVLTGDLLDNDARLADRLGRFVRRLSPAAREGVVVISGNHDFYAGIGAFEAAVRGAGGRLLRNQGQVIGTASAGFSLLGVDDVWARRSGGGPDLQQAVASLPRLDGKVSAALDLPRVLLCHNPSYFQQAAGKVALQLSGHTHGGQVNLGIRPADYILPGGWVAGRYQQSGSQLYVNRGFGTVGPPARIGAAPEVTRIVLTS